MILASAAAKLAGAVNSTIDTRYLGVWTGSAGTRGGVVAEKHETRLAAADV